MLREFFIFFIEVTMANTGVTGRVIFAGTTNGISNLKIQVADLDNVPFEQTLGWGATARDGRFSISYPASSYGVTEWQPDIVVRVYDQYLRLLYATEEVVDVTANTLTIPDIELHSNNISGWLVTNATLNPTTGLPVRLSSGNEINFFIDNESIFNHLTDITNAASTSIFLGTLSFNPDIVTKFMPTMPVIGTRVTGDRLAQKLRDAAGRGVAVRIVINDFTGDPVSLGSPDTADLLTQFFGETPVEVRRYETQIFSPMHAKSMIIDRDIAFLISPPLEQFYFSDASHLIRDPRRGTLDPLQSVRFPIHEVSAKVMGPAVADIGNHFADVWNNLGRSTLTRLSTPAERTSSQIASVQVVRTLPGNKFPGLDAGETGILEAYQRAIANAEDFVYIEDQYFTNPAILEAIIRRIGINQNLQVILLLNIKIDVPGYNALQPRELNRLLGGIRNVFDGTSIDPNDRIGIFTVWSHESPESGGQSVIIPNYIHTKLAIIDDKWLTVGSANTDGTSLNQTQTSDWHARTLSPAAAGRTIQHANPNQTPQPFRAVELNIVAYNNVANLPETSVISNFRRQLWREHLGFSESTDTQLLNRPAGGWLSLWDERAEHKLAGLTTTPIEVRAPRILRWPSVDSGHSDPNNYLRALRINLNQLQVRTEVNSFNFSTGSWM